MLFTISISILNNFTCSFITLKSLRAYSNINNVLYIIWNGYNKGKRYIQFKHANKFDPELFFYFNLMPEVIFY